jgi:hypothetical protein
VLGTTWGVGLTVIVNVFVGPSQVLLPFVKWGVTMIVATTGALPGFVAANEGMLPLPIADNPIDGWSFVQV